MDDHDHQHTEQDIERAFELFGDHTSTVSHHDMHNMHHDMDPMSLEMSMNMNMDENAGIDFDGAMDMLDDAVGVAEGEGEQGGQERGVDARQVDQNGRISQAEEDDNVEAAEREMERFGEDEDDRGEDQTQETELSGGQHESQANQGEGGDHIDGGTDDMDHAMILSLMRNPTPAPTMPTPSFSIPTQATSITNSGPDDNPSNMFSIPTSLPALPTIPGARLRAARAGRDAHDLGGGAEVAEGSGGIPVIGLGERDTNAGQGQSQASGKGSGRGRGAAQGKAQSRGRASQPQSSGAAGSSSNPTDRAQQSTPSGQSQQQQQASTTEVDLTSSAIEIAIARAQNQHGFEGFTTPGGVTAPSSGHTHNTGSQAGVTDSGPERQDPGSQPQEDEATLSKRAEEAAARFFGGANREMGSNGSGVGLGAGLNASMGMGPGLAADMGSAPSSNAGRGRGRPRGRAGVSTPVVPHIPSGPGAAATGAALAGGKRKRQSGGNGTGVSPLSGAGEPADADEHDGAKKARGVGPATSRGGPNPATRSGNQSGQPLDVVTISGELGHVGHANLDHMAGGGEENMDGGLLVDPGLQSEPTLANRMPVDREEGAVNEEQLGRRTQAENDAGPSLPLQMQELAGDDGQVAIELTPTGRPKKVISAEKKAQRAAKRAEQNRRAQQNFRLRREGQIQRLKEEVEQKDDWKLHRNDDKAYLHAQHMEIVALRMALLQATKQGYHSLDTDGSLPFDVEISPPTPVASRNRNPEGSIQESKDLGLPGTLAHVADVEIAKEEVSLRKAFLHLSEVAMAQARARIAREVETEAATDAQRKIDEDAEDAMALQEGSVEPDAPLS